MTLPRLGNPRQKAFSHKVRTGCMTCRRRRVKCDEAKPACLNCTRGNRHCLGYVPPAATVFTLDSGQSSASNRSSSSQSPQTATSEDDLLVFKPLDATFGTDEERRSLQHFLCLTSSVVAHYGPQGDFYTVLVPQLARRSPAVKHMLVALSMTHEKFHTGVATASPNMTSQAVSHYISAIVDIRSNNPPKLHVVIASLVAWVIELFQNNLPAAIVHLRGTLKLLREYQRSKPPPSEQDALQRAILPTASLAKGLTQLMARTGPLKGEIEPGYQGHISYPWSRPMFASFVEARSVICDYIEEIADSENARDLRDIERLVAFWFQSVRRWDQENVPTPTMAALLLLFNLTLALLPSSDVAGFSYSVNPSTIDFVVDKAATLTNIQQKLEMRNEDLKQTLVIVLDFVVRLFPDSLSHGRAVLLLSQLHGQG
ncbi:hypothetical protein AYL99_04115 [Fonsecaea erecta]|uniref:Zn(2)-C6 fungal-type domain-containing protein n=1 Tax=Fonsecaea erecta TaxID=1367422 RepID=A0A178ZQJ0_9EURO|nr:hypothetical protein AYL99_04115 [Fonsecaea erecta]OAP61912.1 hypothetical protein AYL99_04115 [Fonsecaea erecta]